MSDKPPDQWLTTFKQQLSADKKKSVALGGLFLILVAVVVHMFVSDSEPATAEATPIIAAGATWKDQVVPKVRPKPVEPGPTRSAPTAPRSRRIVAVNAMPRVLERDLFNTTAWSRFFPAVIDHRYTDDPNAAEAPKSFWWQLGQAIADHKRTHERESKQLEAELAELELQSTMTGSAPMAYISGRLVHEGDTIRGFSVVRIGDRCVTVRKTGNVRELVMP